MKLDTLPNPVLIGALAQVLLIESRRPGWTETFHGKIWEWFNNEVHREITLEKILDEIALHEWRKLPERWRKPTRPDQKASPALCSITRNYDLKSLPVSKVAAVFGQMRWDANSVLDEAGAWPGCESIRIPKARVQFYRIGIRSGRRFNLRFRFHFFTNANVEIK